MGKVRIPLKLLQTSKNKNNDCSFAFSKNKKCAHPILNVHSHCRQQCKTRPDHFADGTATRNTAKISILSIVRLHNRLRYKLLRYAMFPVVFILNKRSHSEFETPEEEGWESRSAKDEVCPPSPPLRCLL